MILMLRSLLALLLMKRRMLQESGSPAIVKQVCALLRTHLSSTKDVYHHLLAQRPFSLYKQVSHMWHCMLDKVLCDLGFGRPNSHTGPWALKRKKSLYFSVVYIDDLFEVSSI